MTTSSPCHLVTLSPCHLVTLSPCHLVTLSPCHSSSAALTIGTSSSFDRRGGNQRSHWLRCVTSWNRSCVKCPSTAAATHQSTAPTSANPGINPSRSRSRSLTSRNGSQPKTNGGVMPISKNN